MSNSLELPWTVTRQAPWNSPGKNTGAGYRFLLQGIFRTKRLNPCLLHLLQWQAASLPTVPPGKPLQSIRVSYKKNIITKNSVIFALTAVGTDGSGTQRKTHTY